MQLPPAGELWIWMESSLWLTCLQRRGFQSMWVRSGRASGMCLRSPRRRAEGSWLCPASSRGQPAPSQLLVGFGCSSWCRRCLCAVWGVLGPGLDLRSQRVLAAADPCYPIPKAPQPWALCWGLTRTELIFVLGQGCCSLHWPAFIKQHVV